MLRLGYSFCPNDTFIFHALTHGLVEGPPVDQQLEDVETLNRWAEQGRLEVTKVSAHAYFHVLDRYVALRSGGALGRGVGPLLVSLPGRPLRSVAHPGDWTTARLLLDLACPEIEQRVALRYDQIVEAILAGQVDGGVLIHETRFAYRDYGLEARLDLGQWWEEHSGLPLPLGLILVRRDLDEGLQRELQQRVRLSLERALADPQRSLDYIRQHARELDDATIERHIRTYVNEFSLDVGDEGVRAVEALHRRALQAGRVNPANLPLFVNL